MLDALIPFCKSVDMVDDEHYAYIPCPYFIKTKLNDGILIRSKGFYKGVYVKVDSSTVAYFSDIEEALIITRKILFQMYYLIIRRKKYKNLFIYKQIKKILIYILFKTYSLKIKSITELKPNLIFHDYSLLSGDCVFDFYHLFKKTKKILLSNELLSLEVYYHESFNLVPKRYIDGSSFTMNRDIIVTSMKSDPKKIHDSGFNGSIVQYNQSSHDVTQDNIGDENDVYATKLLKQRVLIMSRRYTKKVFSSFINYLQAFKSIKETAIKNDLYLVIRRHPRENLFNKILLFLYLNPLSYNTHWQFTSCHYSKHINQLNHVVFFYSGTFGYFYKNNIPTILYRKNIDTITKTKILSDGLLVASSHQDYIECYKHLLKFTKKIIQYQLDFYNSQFFSENGFDTNEF